MRYCIGIDLGGTFIKFGILDSEFRLVGKTFQLPTPVGEGSDAVIAQMVKGGRQAMDSAGVAKGVVVGVGVGAPGPLDLAAGVVIAMPNIPGMDGLPLRDRLGSALGVPGVLENDANAAGFGEYLCGAGHHSGDMVLLTLGTGVGSGIVVEGKVLHGSHGMGAELGHLIVVPDGEVCNCGQRGCLERYASATFMSRAAERMLLCGGKRQSLLLEVLATKGELTAKDICEARRAGDGFAAGVWDAMARHLASGCVSIARILDPERIVLGGGMAAAGEDLLGPVRRHFSVMHWALTGERTEIVLATLGNDAGVIGAAGVAMQKFAA
jgi:glucokinase